MRVETSKYAGQYLKKLALSEGNFYFFKDFIVGELNHGVHFTYEKGKVLIDEVYNLYGQDVNVSYISNRVNSYSVHAQDWLKFYKERHHIDSYAIVAYNKIGLMNVMLEKLFSQARMRKFGVLDDAVNWVMKFYAEKEAVSKESDSIK